MAHILPRKWFGFSVSGLLLLLICALVVPVLLVQTWLYRQQYRIRREAELQANLEVARGVAAAFEAFVGDVRRENVAVGQALPLLQPFTIARANHYLLATRQEYPAVRVLSWVSSEGRVLASSDPGLVGQDWGARPWRPALAGGRGWVVTDVSRPRRMREARFEVAVSPSSSQRAVQGVVVASVDLSRLDEVIDIGRSGSAAVSLQDSTGWLAFRLPALELPYAERDWGKLYPRSVRRALDGHEAKAVEYLSYRKERRIIGSVPVTGTGWAASAGRPETEAMAPVRADIAESVAIVAGAALLALLLALLAARAIARPLHRLRQHALAFGRGEVARRAEVTGPSDLAALSGAFNQMADDLQQRQREQEQAREALRASEQRWATTLASIGDAVIATDVGGRITFMNRVAEQLTDWTSQEAAARPVTEVFHIVNEVTRQEVESPVAKVLREGLVVGLANHTLLVRRDGSEVPIDDSGAPIADGNGDVTGVVLVFHDITARRQAEAALRESERRYRSLFENMLDGYAYCRMLYADGVPQDFVYLDVNSAFERLTGLKDVVGRRVSEVIPGIRETNPEVFEVYGRVARSGRPERLEVYLDSLEMWLSIAVYSPAEEHFVAVFDNVTARKRAEEALRVSEERARSRAEELATVLDAVPAAVWISHDPESRVITGNAYADEIVMGAPRGGNISQSARPGEAAVSYHVFREEVEVAPEQLPAQRAAATGKSVFDQELELRFSDGRIVHMVLSAVPLFDAEGRVRGSVTAGADVTALRQAERARAEVAEQMTEEINHRMKNNLTLLAGVLSMQALAQPQASAAAHLLRDAVTRLTALSAVHEQLYEAKSARVELRNILQRIAAMDADALSAADISIHVSGDETSISSKLGSTLALVANELITNALEYGSPGGSGKLEIEVAVSRRADGLRLRVWNSGSPVPEGFDAGKQSGMGLSLVDGVVTAQLKGSFALRAERGGTAAEVFVPEAAIRAAEFVPVGDGKARPSV